MDESESHKQNWDFSQITELIYLGADMCCEGDHYDYLCSKMGIKADVAIVEEQLETPSLLLEEFLWLPVKDKTTPNQTQLDVGVGFIDACVRNKKKVFVHCRLGHGRSPTVVTAYFISRGMDVAQAIEKVRAARPEMHLEVVQRQALEGYKNKLKR